MHGDVTFEHFEGETWRDPEVRKLLQRIETRPHAHKPNGMYEHFQGEVVVTTTDGRRFSDPCRPAVAWTDELCAAGSAGAEIQGLCGEGAPRGLDFRVYQVLEKFETLGDVRGLTTVMAESAKTGGRILEAA